MDRNFIKSNLRIDNLKNYIIEEISAGKKEAEIGVEEAFNINLENLQNIEKDNVKVSRILLIILKNKTDLSLLSTDFLTQMIRGNQDKSKFSKPFENEELDDLADYILDYLDFNNTSNVIICAKLTSIRNESIKYHAATSYISKCKSLFDILNDKCKLDKYMWDWSNFEEGLQKVLINYELEKISSKLDIEAEIKIIESNKEFEISKLNREIEKLSKEVESLNNKNQYMIDFYNKYYDANQVTTNETFFGDNLPFLFNLFVFFKKNNLFIYNWSYFYACMIIGNNQMIPLSTSKKLNFVGRIFYNLIYYLTSHYKDESFKFLQSKFLINDLSISDNFRTNHMKKIYDKRDYPELIAIDDFFENQKEIYIKM